MHCNYHNVNWLIILTNLSLFVFCFFFFFNANISLTYQFHILLASAMVYQDFFLFFQWDIEHVKQGWCQVGILIILLNHLDWFFLKLKSCSFTLISQGLLASFLLCPTSNALLVNFIEIGENPPEPWPLLYGQGLPYKATKGPTTCEEELHSHVPYEALAWGLAISSMEIWSTEMNKICVSLT